MNVWYKHYARFAVFVVLAGIWGCKDGAPKRGETTFETAPAAISASESSTPDFSVGDKAPVFELLDLEDKKRSLSSFGGKVILLNFWATWCGPCVAEMGSLERLHKTHRDKGFEVVGINVDAEQNLEGVRKFARENGITFSILRDPELTFPQVYNLTGFPESLFIGKDGKFVAFADPAANSTGVRVVGDRAWDSPNFIKAVAELLK